MRPITSSAFVAGNLQMVYQSCSQLKALPDSKKKLDTLNDALFSHSIHPNSGAEFDLLFSVIAHQPDDFVCPICLYPPVAPRMTHCGHIFCADCILQHQMINAPACCPVCYESIDETNFVRTDLRLHMKTNQFTFKKILRSKHNCACFLSSTTEMSVLPTASNPSAPFCRFFIADNDYVHSIVSLERSSVANQIETYKEYEAATKISLLESIHESLVEEPDVCEPGPKFILQNTSLQDCLTFYQDELGRLIFFDPLSLKMLHAQFPNLQDSPETIEISSLKSSNFTVDQRFRRRNPALGHLPAGAEVSFILADLKDIVSPDILEAFKTQIENRLQVEEEHEEEEELLSEMNFPSLASDPELDHQLPTKNAKGWAKINPEDYKKKTIDDEFPTLGGPTPPPASNKPKPNAWAKVQSPQKANNEYPSLGASVPKRQHSWA